MSLIPALCGAVFFGVGAGKAKPVTQAKSSILDLSLDEVNALLRKRMKDVPDAGRSATALQVVRLSRKLGFQPSFVLSLIQAESSFRFDAVSPVGAIGLMQIMPRTAAYVAAKSGITEYSHASDLYRPEVNVAIGIHYLAYLRRKHPNHATFLRAYNLGPTKLNRITLPAAERLEGVGRYVNRILLGVRGIAQDAMAMHLLERPAAPVCWVRSELDLASI